MGFSSGSKSDLPGNVAESHLPTWGCILSTEPLICAAENTGSVTHDHECANYLPSKFFIKLEELHWFGFIICKLGLQAQDSVLFLSSGEDLMLVYSTCAGSQSNHGCLGAGQWEDIVLNLMSFIALNLCNWKRNLEINIFLSSEEDILKATQWTEQTYHYYVLSHDITRISLSLEK